MKFPSKVIELLCESKDKKRFDTALEKKYEYLYRLAYAWCHQPAQAQDLVQETMLKALESRKNLDSLEHFDAWLCKILHNQFLDNMRYNRRWDYSEEAEIDQFYVAECCETKAIQRQAKDAVHQAMTKLSFEQRQVITLSDLQGFSYQEISDITSTPIGTVMSRISRGREKLNMLLKASYDHQNNVVSIRRN